MKRILIILLLAVAAFPAFAQMGTGLAPWFNYIGVTLAIQAAVQFTSRENRPDFQILLYPFTTMNDFENNIMFGPDASEELIKKYSVLEQIKPDTPRALSGNYFFQIFHR